MEPLEGDVRALQAIMFSEIVHLHPFSPRKEFQFLPIKKLSIPCRHLIPLQMFGGVCEEQREVSMTMYIPYLRKLEKRDHVVLQSSMCICVCISVCVLCVRAHVHMHASTCMCMSLCTCTCVHVYTQVHSLVCAPVEARNTHLYDCVSC